MRLCRKRLKTFYFRQFFKISAKDSRNVILKTEVSEPNVYDLLFRHDLLVFASNVKND